MVICHKTKEVGNLHLVASLGDTQRRMPYITAVVSAFYEKQALARIPLLEIAGFFLSVSSSKASVPRNYFFHFFLLFFFVSGLS